MKTKLLALVLALAGGTATASPDGVMMADLSPNLATESARDLHQAVEQVRADARRVRSADLELTAAENDLQKAQITTGITASKLDEAVRKGHVNLAGYWAPRHARALRMERRASLRVAREREEHAFAIAELERSTAAVRHAGARASRRATAV